MRLGKRERAQRKLEAKYLADAKARADSVGTERARFVMNWDCMHPHAGKRNPSERFTGFNQEKTVKKDKGRHIRL